MTLASISDYFLDQVPDACTRCRVERGEYVYKVGDNQPLIYLIERGVVKTGSLGPQGERVVYDVLQPGETFGDLDYLDEVEFFEFAQAATSAVVLAVDRSVFRHRTVHDPVVAEWFGQAVVRRWYKAEVRLLQRARETVENRLLHLSRQYGTPVRDADHGLHLPFELLSHQEMADLVGATRQTVSKKLKQVLRS